MFYKPISLVSYWDSVEVVKSIHLIGEEHFLSLSISLLDQWSIDLYIHYIQYIQCSAFNPTTIHSGSHKLARLWRTAYQCFSQSLVFFYF